MRTVIVARVKGRLAKCDKRRKDTRKLRCKNRVNAKLKRLEDFIAKLSKRCDDDSLYGQQE